MSYLRLSDNIVMLRHKKEITQDQLATFLGVTKASVSKWETKQSYPDILLLPQIAAYFDVSIDELLGYEPQMSPEQIKKCYQDLASDFATLPFDEVVTRSRQFVKKYYSCYPLLMQIVVLWINHFMLTEDREKQTTILKEAVELCNHIRASCNEVGLCNEAIALKAVANLTLGNAKDVIEDLEPLYELKKFITQSDLVLFQAYQIIGDNKKAELHSQITIYTQLLNLVENSIAMIGFHIRDQEFCDTTIHRIDQIIEAYQLESLHPNTTLKYHYQSALYYCVHQQIEKALVELTVFVNGSLHFIESGLVLHGDDYFNRLEEWFQGFDLQTDAPRNERVVLDSLIPAIEYPGLSILFEHEQYIHLKKQIERKRNV
ncbi:helix-turn-helix domain-containing protein [Anaeromicropila herbilytica]|uniref:Transcriptional regulator n=1 Tax=Anaeromicropila herbilytica TaxID=2785025 RepID=A0A7R7ID88_9FIRM|nr:helix-turn-helix transcriptional regulator [Anaeromicropila herbilytica]BCN30784.1 transcriptional regulator [Anaeromicropila herbilytica]